MKFNKKWLKNKWVAYTIATCSAVVLYMALSHINLIFTGLSYFFSFVRPVIIGIIIAYVFNPLANILGDKIFKGIKNDKTRWKVSTFCAIIIIVACFTLLGIALIPQLAESVSTLFSNMDSYLMSLQNLLREFEKGSGLFLGLNFRGVASFGDSILGKASEYFSNNMESIAGVSADVGRGIFDVVIGTILAIYFLFDKHRIVNGITRLCRLLMKNETYDKTAVFLTRCNDILIRYISVDVVDGIIVGIVNFVFMILMGMPYSVLISVIVGVTNLAPTFGPIAGAIVGGLILVLVNPWYALWFLIFTIILQTADGYIIKPKLFGGSLGVSSLMILISIILGGRLFGVGGILIAIPFAAIIDFVWKDFVLKRLEQRHAKKYNI